ncbi:MAG: HPF/RaiA family ribosome-associated protein, partial [Burkholderiales bacterium]
MQIQINSDHHITGSPQLAGRVQTLVRGALERYSDRITRVEVHLNDLNGVKGGGSDKRCLME